MGFRRGREMPILPRSRNRINARSGHTSTERVHHDENRSAHRLVKSAHFRRRTAPEGSRRITLVISMVMAIGYLVFLRPKHYVIGWNIRSLDTVYENEDVIFERVKSKVKPGGIILLHDTSQKSVNVLERLLLFLKSENYSIVSVDKLLNLSAYEN
jgi:peptidoglycan/xylan/chitin deacetylase (PgdA/CDA1 family)